MPTISDISKKAGVSTATVSRYINQSGYVGKKASENIEAAIQALDYAPNAAAVSLSKKTSQVIGVMVPEISNPFFSKVLDGITKEAEKAGYVVMIFDTNESIEKELSALKALKQQNVCGLLLTPVCDDQRKNPEFYNALKKMTFPTVFMDREVSDYEASGVFYDNFKGMYDLTESLIEEGHHSVTLVAGDESLKLGRDRTEGYKKSINHESIICGCFDREKARVATLNLLKNHQPDAIVSSNNMMTEGVIQALHEMDLTNQITIASFDKIYWAEFVKMHITHLDRNPSDMGHHAVELLLEQLKSKKINKIYLKPRVKRRNNEI